MEVLKNFVAFPEYMNFNLPKVLRHVSHLMIFFDNNIMIQINIMTDSTEVMVVISVMFHSQRDDSRLPWSTWIIKRKKNQYI